MAMQRDKAKPTAITKTKNGIGPGDWVRVLRNDVGALSPVPGRDGQHLLPYEAIKVAKIETRSSRDAELNGQQVLIFLVGRSSGYIPAKDVELLTECICSPALTKTCGCRCGWQIKLDAEEREQMKKDKPGL